MLHHLHIFLHLRTNLLHHPLTMHQAMREVTMNNKMTMRKREIMSQEIKKKEIRRQMSMRNKMKRKQ